MEINQQSSLKSNKLGLSTRNQAKSTGIARKRRKNKSKNKKKAKQRRSSSKKYPNKVNVNLAMSSTSWPHDLYTKASEWQFKHEIAYWKAKAKALECENRILHDIIRKKSGSLSSGIGASTSASISDSESEDMPSASCDEDISSASEDEFRRHVENDEQLEVSEAFIDFLTMNAKYKEDARQERERLKSKDFETEEERIKRMEQPPPAVHEDNSEDLEKLYGPRWQKISALEMSLNCQFMSDCDKLKPVYWPNIPFNFNFSQ